MDVNMPADVVKSGLQQPTMFITRDASAMHLEHKENGTWSDHDITLTLTTMRAVYHHLRPILTPAEWAIETVSRSNLQFTLNTKKQLWKLIGDTFKVYLDQKPATD